jgi:methionyl-tRNA formyltransferase
MLGKIVLLSASPYSALSTTVAAMLIDNDVKIEMIVVRNVFNKKRLIQEFKHSGFALIKKIIKKIIFQKLISMGFNLKNIDGFTRYYKSKGIKYKSLLDLCTKNNIKLIVANDFHAEEVIHTIKESKVDMVVFSGGGLIRKPMLESTPIGVLNCHSGILPEYRGMDCTNWAILNNDYSKIGYTTHIMEAGVDTGPIVKRYYVNAKNAESAKAIDAVIEFGMADAIVESTIKLLKNEVQFVDQTEAEGVQYYMMAPELQKHAHKILTNGK